MIFLLVTKNGDRNKFWYQQQKMAMKMAIPEIDISLHKYKLQYYKNISFHDFPSSQISNIY